MSESTDEGKAPTDPTSKALNTNVERRISKWHPSVRELDPGPTDPVARSSWADEMEPVAKRAAQTPGFKVLGKSSAEKKNGDAADESSGTGSRKYTFQKPGDAEW